MKVFRYEILGILTILLPASIQADTLVRTVYGASEGGQAVAFDVTVDFTQTGGDFSLGTGTATVKFTLENTSGLYPFQSPAMGNPILTRFYFNVTPDATVTYTEAMILSGSSIYSTGTTMLGVTIPAGCQTLTTVQSRTPWYELQQMQTTGLFGIFTTSLETLEGIKGGFVDPDVLLGCVPQGDIFSPIVIAGRVQFTLELGSLDGSLDSAWDFLDLCSVVPGEQSSSAFAGKFRGTDENGDGSGFIGDEGNCSVPVEDSSWGAVKVIYQ